MLHSTMVMSKEVNRYPWVRKLGALETVATVLVGDVGPIAGLEFFERKL